MLDTHEFVYKITSAAIKMPHFVKSIFGGNFL